MTIFRQELIERNILKDESYFRDRAATREALSGKLTRRLSLRPTAEELEQRNILYQNTPEERLKEKDMKKKVLYTILFPIYVPSSYHNGRIRQNCPCKNYLRLFHAVPRLHLSVS